MNKLASKGIIMGAVGLVIGYFIFGKIAGNYVSIETLVNPPQNFLENITESLTGIKKIRQNILISGIVGAGFGLILGTVSKKK